MTKADPTTFGLIGCGRVAPRHAQSIGELTRARLVAVADVVRSRGERFAKEQGAAAYQDYRYLLDRKDIDVACICTPSGIHSQMGVDAAYAGKHVTVEKPMALTAAEAGEMRAAAQRNGRYLTVNHNRWFDPVVQQARALLGSGARFLLGTDTQGRDVLSRVLYGARLSLLVGVISQAVAVSLGVLLGLVAGYYQRWVDAVVMRLADVTLAFPTLLLLIAVAAAVRPSLPVIFVVIGVVGWAGMARIVRGQVLVLKGAEYVAAARALGARDRRVLWRHLLPNVQAQVMIAATLGIAGAILEAATIIGLVESVDFLSHRRPPMF